MPVRPSTKRNSGQDYEPSREARAGTSLHTGSRTLRGVVAEEPSRSPLSLRRRTSSCARPDTNGFAARKRVRGNDGARAPARADAANAASRLLPPGRYRPPATGFGLGSDTRSRASTALAAAEAAGLPAVAKAVDSELVHAAERTAGRGIFASKAAAADALRALSSDIASGGWPWGAIMVTPVRTACWFHLETAVSQCIRWLGRACEAEDGPDDEVAPVANGRIELTISDDDADVGYMSLPAHPGRGVPKAVTRQVALRELLPEYKGPEVYLDLDATNQLVGIEIVG
jgi:hypothetical protein